MQTVFLKNRELAHLIDHAAEDKDKKIKLIDYILTLEQTVKQHRNAVKAIKKSLDQITR